MTFTEYSGELLGDPCLGYVLSARLEFELDWPDLADLLAPAVSLGEHLGVETQVTAFRNSKRNIKISPAKIARLDSEYAVALFLEGWEKRWLNMDWPDKLLEPFAIVYRSAGLLEVNVPGLSVRSASDERHVDEMVRTILASSSVRSGFATRAFQSSLFERIGYGDLYTLAGYGRFVALDSETFATVEPAFDRLGFGEVVERTANGVLWDAGRWALGTRELDVLDEALIAVRNRKGRAIAGTAADWFACSTLDRQLLIAGAGVIGEGEHPDYLAGRNAAESMKQREATFGSEALFRPPVSWWGERDPFDYLPLGALVPEGYPDDFATIFRDALD